MAVKYIKLQDGDNLSVIVETPPSASDPGGEIAGVCQVFRVVANSWAPTLELIPLGNEPGRLANIPELNEDGSTRA